MNDAIMKAAHEVTKFKRQAETLAYEMLRDRDQRRWAVESVDPDWTDHYGDLDRAFEDYWGDEQARSDMITELCGSFA